jgi:CRP/FNR family cyclic AMP-dependent transcriptional regulator
MATATAMTECSILRLQKGTMVRMLHNEPALSELFMSYLLSRNVRIEEDLGKDGQHEPVVPRTSQETWPKWSGQHDPG